MAFVNEYASDEDVEKYGLKEIWDKYHTHSKGDYFSGYKPTFTIDRERNIFLLALGQASGADGNRTMFLMWWSGNEIRVDLELTAGSSRKTNEQPFFRVWELAYIRVPQGFEAPETEVIEILKEAVQSYGYRGMAKQIPNTIVKFSF
jgi:hypothetical protein